MKFALPTIHLSLVVLYTFSSYLNIETKKLAEKNRSSKRTRNLHNVNFSHMCDTVVVDPRNKLVFISDCVKTWFLLFHVKMKTRKTIPEKRILKKAKFGFRRQNYIPKNVNILWRSIEKHVIFEQKLFFFKDNFFGLIIQKLRSRNYKLPQ